MTVPAFDLEDYDENADVLPGELERINRIANQAANAKDESHIAAVLLSAFIAYKVYASRKLVSRGVDEILAAEQLNARAKLTWRLFSPYFAIMVMPLFTSAVLKETKRALPNETRHALALDYANRLGTYFAATSAEAMVAGFNGMVNRKILPRVAAERAAAAFGLTKRQMNGYVAASFDEKRDINVRNLNPARMRTSYVVKSLDKRLDTLTKNEAFKISQEAQQVAWLWELKHGDIPRTSKKVWFTAADELVCKICGPMNGKAVGVKEHFELPSGEKTWVAGVHPRCRCRIRLVTRELIGKNISDRDWDAREHPRGQPGNAGQFRSKTKTRVDPFLQRVLEEAEQAYDKPTLSAKPTLTAKPVLSAKPILGEPKPILGDKPTLGSQTKPELKAKRPKLRAAKPELSAAKPFLSDVAPARIAELEAKRKEVIGQIVEDVQKHTVLLGDEYLTGSLDIDAIEHGRDGKPVMIKLETREFTNDKGEVVSSERNYQFGRADEYQMDEYISQWINDEVESMSYFLEDEASDRKMIEREFDGVMAEADLTDNGLIYDVLFAAAQGYPDDDGTDVKFLDHAGNEVATQWMSYMELGHHMGIDTDSFVVPIYRTREVHRGSMIHGGSMHGYEEWSIDGMYEVVSEGYEELSSGVTIEIFDLRPIEDD